MMIADVELPKRRRNGPGHAGIAMTQTEDAAVAMAVDQSKLRVRIFKPNALTFPHHDLEAHALVVRELVRRDVLTKHGHELIKGFERRGQRVEGHRLESTRGPLPVPRSEMEPWRKRCVAGVQRRSFCAIACREVAKYLMKAPVYNGTRLAMCTGRPTLNRQERSRELITPRPPQLVSQRSSGRIQHRLDR